MKQKWRKMFGLDEEKLRHIDWEVFVKTHKILPDWKNIWMMKHNSRIWVVQKIWREDNT